jgi:hypothetical protein
MTPTQRTQKAINSSHLLEDLYIDSFRFTNHTPTYLVFELVLTNVAASYGYLWKDIENAPIHSKDKYVARVIAYILIFRILYRIGRIKTKEAMKKLIGEYNFKIVSIFNEDIA